MGTELSMMPLNTTRVECVSWGNSVMARKDDQNQTQSDSSDELEGNVDQIRQILFGGQMRDYEKRFAEMEKRLTKSIEQLSGVVEKRIDRLDTYAKREFDKVADKLKAEQKARAETDKQGSKDLDNLGQQVEGWFAEIEEQMESESRQLHAALKEQGEDLLGAINDQSEHFNSSLREEAGDLAESKVGREDLAGMLAELALRLKKDFKLPKG